MGKFSTANVGPRSDGVLGKGDRVIKDGAVIEFG